MKALLVPAVVLAVLTAACTAASPGEGAPATVPEATPTPYAAPVEADAETSASAAPAADGAFAPIRFGDAEEHAYTAPFFPGATYDPSLPAPESVTGQLHASRLSHYDEIVACFRLWAAASPRMTLHEHGRTHEGRALVHAVVTSPANHARLDEILADVARLHDPRGLDDAEAERIVAETPAVAWMGYSIHGDETSGADASVALGYHLVACTDEAVASLLDDLVVVIEPVMNPDGRERILSMVEQSAGRTASLDWASMHRGRWPYGRGNHYLFDMNRDWMAGTQPETRGRWEAILRFHPQLLVDAHEMGSLDTFLIYPQATPLNPHLSEKHIEWQKRFAADTARAFDAYGWGYYTREWADGWAPFYTDAWGSLAGATGILYEQARTVGSALMRASGRILTYREAVHHQALASWANLGTLAAHREAALRDYLENKRRAVSDERPGSDRMFVLVPGAHAGREAELARALAGQGIELFRATDEFEAQDAVDRFGARSDRKTFPKGAWIVPVRQPMGAMVKSYLELDSRMDDESLRAEREDVERKGESRIYDVTAWSLVHALDVDGYWVDASEAAREALPIAVQPDGGLAGADDARTAFGWVVDGDLDASVAFAARAMERGLQVHLSDEPFTAAGRTFPRGSLLVRRDENTAPVETVTEHVARAAAEAGVLAHAIYTGRSPDEGPDLGGGHFRLLARPRVGLLSNAPLEPETFGHLWHLLDTRLGVPLALLDAQALGYYDLRRYNVLIVPSTWGGIAGTLEPHADALRTWVRAGGTLIACEDAAAALTAGNLGLSEVTLRRDALEELEAFERQAEREIASRTIEIDAAAVWGDASAAEADDAAQDDDDDDEASEVDADEDRWQRRFSPRGVTLRGLVDTQSWLTAGAGDEMPVYFTGSNAFLTKAPVRTPVRLAEAERLRLGGLVWPEARERLGRSAWLTVESSGDGQVILFASMPAFRGYHLATGRLFANAVIYGPGVGASQPVGW